MTFYPDIFATEATVSSATHNEIRGSISKLSGQIGEEFIKMYPRVCVIVNGVEVLRDTSSYYGFTFMVGLNYNFFKLCSTVKEFPINIGDDLLFYFQDRSSLKIKFGTGGYKIGKEKHLLTVISNMELDHFSRVGVQYFQITKGANTVRCSFSDNIPNHQYSSGGDGQKLFMIMAERIIGCKILLAKGVK